jgi:reactive intermediate/imine deaminase
MHTPIHTDDAPEAIGTYSQAVATDGLVFLSGQIALDPATMALVDGGFEAQTRQVFDNLRAVCREAGGDLGDVVKFTIYVTELGNFPVVNTVMDEYLDAPFPARATVQVSALPKGAEVEVDAFMVLPKA